MCYKDRVNNRVVLFNLVQSCDSINNLMVRSMTQWPSTFTNDFHIFKKFSMLIVEFCCLCYLFSYFVLGVCSLLYFLLYVFICIFIHVRTLYLCLSFKHFMFVMTFIIIQSLPFKKIQNVKYLKNWLFLRKYTELIESNQIFREL